MKAIYETYKIQNKSWPSPTGQSSVCHLQTCSDGKIEFMNSLRHFMVQFWMSGQTSFHVIARYQTKYISTQQLTNQNKFPLSN